MGKPLMPLLRGGHALGEPLKPEGVSPRPSGFDLEGTSQMIWELHQDCGDPAEPTHGAKGTPDLALPTPGARCFHASKSALC